MDPLYSAVSAVLGAQMSKTDGVILNSIGHTMDERPIPSLYIGPTQKNVESLSKDRFYKMLQSVPTLYEGLAKGKRDTISEKFINGIRIGFGWAGSATELASHPAGRVYIDERDRMSDDVQGEGDPNTLAEARTSTFVNSCVTTVSTPKIGTVETYDEHGLTRWKVTSELHSPIWHLWQEGTRHEWCWPCPDCKEYFIPRMVLLWWPDGSTPQEVLHETRLKCPHCGVLIENKRKKWMNDRGVFVAPGQYIDSDIGNVIDENGDSHPINPGHYLQTADGNTHASFWVSGICSPWRSFGQRARAFVTAAKTGEPGKIQGVINTAFGELYSVGGEAPNWQIVANLRQPYPFGAVPTGVQVIVAGVDVQDNRLVYVVRGFGYNYSSWLIEHGEIWGDTSHTPVWDSLSELLHTQYDEISISRMLIDSGYKPGGKNSGIHMVYEFCRRYKGVAIPTKGKDKQDQPFRFSQIEVKNKGKVGRPITLCHVHTHYFKSWIYSRLEWPDDQEGRWLISKDSTDEYCQQVVSEAPVPKRNGDIVWIKLRKDNHYFDCEVLATVGAHMLQVHRLQPIKSGQPDAPPTRQRRVRSSGVR